MLGGDLAELKLASHPGIGEDDVEGSALGLHRRVEPVEVGLIRDRALHRAGIGPEVGHSGVERFLPAAEDEDEGALLDEALCCGAADAGSATRDDCNLTFKLSHDFSFQAPSLVVRGGTPRTSRWVRRSQALSAEARTSVVRNRSGWTTDASRDDRCPPFGIGPRSST